MVVAFIDMVCVPEPRGAYALPRAKMAKPYWGWRIEQFSAVVAEQGNSVAFDVGNFPEHTPRWPLHSFQNISYQTAAATMRGLPKDINSVSHEADQSR